MNEKQLIRYWASLINESENINEGRGDVPYDWEDISGPYDDGMSIPDDDFDDDRFRGKVKNTPTPKENQKIKVGDEYVTGIYKGENTGVVIITKRNNDSVDYVYVHINHLSERPFTEHSKVFVDRDGYESIMSPVGFCGPRNPNSYEDWEVKAEDMCYEKWNNELREKWYKMHHIPLNKWSDSTVVKDHK